MNTFIEFFHFLISVNESGPVNRGSNGDCNKVEAASQTKTGSGAGSGAFTGGATGQLNDYMDDRTRGGIG